MMPRMKSPGRSSHVFDESVSLQRLARQWNMPRRKVRRLIQKGKLPFIEIAGQIRIPSDQIPAEAPSV